MKRLLTTLFLFCVNFEGSEVFCSVEFVSDSRGVGGPEREGNVESESLEVSFLNVFVREFDRGDMRGVLGEIFGT